MTAGESYANPLDFDMTAAAGSQLFDFENPSPPPWTYYNSSNTSTSYFPASAALDGDINTCWETNGLDVGNTWYAIGASDGNPIILNTYSLRPRSGWAGRMPSAWTLEGSDDGATWTVVDTQSGITNWDGGGAAQDFTLAAPATNKYFRINVSAISADSIVDLGEIYLNGTPNPTAASPLYFYVRVRGLPNNRVYSPTVAAGTTNIVNEWSAWTAWTEAYPENTGDSIGYYNPNGGSTFTSFGNFRDGGIILRFKLGGYGNFTWSWTSVDYPDRPQQWESAVKELDASGGVQDYDTVNQGVAGLMNRRYYTLTPATTDAIILSTNEPYGYFEVYHETGLRPYDQYITEGQSLVDGTVDPKYQCVWQPAIGETYVIVVYCNSQSDPTVTHRLTWVTQAIQPPAYVVANDVVTAPITIPNVGTSGSFTYDNTGATEDSSSYYDGPRSIWYAFTATANRYLCFRATPGNANAQMPRLDVRDTSGNYVSANQANPIAGELVFQAVAGTTYLIEMTWPNANVLTPWDYDGFCSWAYYDIPNDSFNTPTTLTTDSTVTGQNISAASPIPNYVGNGQWFRIDILEDCGLCLALERPVGNTDSMSAQLYLMTPTWQYPRTYMGDLPVRDLGADTPKTMIRAAKAGDSYLIRVACGTDGAILRWGKSTDVTWGVWHSGDGSSYTTTRDSAGNIVPVAPGTAAWPVTDYGSSVGPVDMHWSASDSNSISSQVPPDPSPFAPLTTAVAGGMNASDPAPQNTAVYGPGVHWHGGQIYDPSQGTVATDVEFNNDIVGYQAKVIGNTDPNFASYPPQVTARKDRCSNVNIQPVFSGASFRLQDLDPNYADPPAGIERNELGDWMWADGYTSASSANYDLQNRNAIRQYAIEWSGDNPTNKPCFNIYRAYSASWSKNVGASGPATGFIPGNDVAGQLIETPNVLPSLGGGNPPSFMGPSIPGVQLAAFVALGSDQMGSGIYQPFGFPADRSDNFWSALKNDCLAVADVTNGQYPDNTFTYTEVYGCSSNLPDSIDPTGYANQLQQINPDGGIGGEGWCPDYNFSISWQVNLLTGRKYPDQYRVGKYAPTLAPLDAGPAPGPSTFSTLGTDSTGNTGEYVFEGAVGVGTAGPILWFLYKRWSFLGNHILAYGQGLGDTQATLHGVLKMGPGEAYPLSGDVNPSVVGWQVNAASNHAYDGTGVIYPGTDIAPPRVDVEVQVLEFIVPNDLTLDVPTQYHVYVTNDHGTSNALPLMLYPIVDMPMGASAPELTSMSRAMGVWDMDAGGGSPMHAMALMAAPAAPPAPPNTLEQRFSRIPVSYVLSSTIPEQAPEFLTSAEAACTLTIGAPTNGLDDPANVSLPLDLRYRPLDSQIVPRPDLSSTTSAWQPLAGAPYSWRFDTGAAPYIDSTTTVVSRSGDLVRPSLVFPGNSFAQLTDAFPTGPTLTIAMVVKILPDAQARSYVLASYTDTPQDTNTYPLEVYVEGDQLYIVVGATIQTVKIAPGYIGTRPIILAMTLDNTMIRTAVVSDRAMVQVTTHPRMMASGVKLYLGRSGGSDPQSANMDVFDLAVDTHVIEEAQFWQIINIFDGAYGVTK